MKPLMKMVGFVLLALLAGFNQITGQTWNNSDGLLPWQSLLELGHIERPLGLTLNYSSLAHHHFAIGYLCLHSFMYDEAQEAFDLALNSTPTFVEPHIAKILSCKHALWSDTDFECGLTAYNATMSMLNTSGVILTPLQESLLSAEHAWFANRTSIAAGERAFLSSISDLSKRYANESDIAVLRGLSLLNVAFESEGESEVQAKTMDEARAVLRSALSEEPSHPGALHYLIHAYDVPERNISENAIDYVLSYEKLVHSSSHAHHIPAHIWIRTGSMLSAKSADEAAIQASFDLCLTKLTGRSSPITTNRLSSIFIQLNTTAHIPMLLQCDAINRATATEWLSFSSLQLGDWVETFALINDLFVAHNRSLPASKLYLTSFYASYARAVINMFYWLPYDGQFINKTEELQQRFGTLPLVALGDEATGWKSAWSEAGYRLSDCIRLLTASNGSYNDPLVKPRVDDHLTRFEILSNRTAPLNNYISKSISLMILQVRGIIYFKNNTWQECLNVLDDAAQRESQLLPDMNSPILIFARSSELLAMHLLLIHRKFAEDNGTVNSTKYELNGSQVFVRDFPKLALALYRTANESAPNRAINILGMARAYAQLRLNGDAVIVYQKLLAQISVSNNTDETFSQEATGFKIQKEELQGSATSKQLSVSLAMLLVLIQAFLTVGQ